MAEVLTDRLRLRPFVAADVPAWHREVFADDEVMRYLPAGRAVPVEHARGVFERFEAHRVQHGFAPWAATRREDGVLLGHCGLRQVPEAGEVEVLYALGREHWGQGLATEGAGAALRFGFEVLGFDRIVAYAVPENAASRRVMEHCGLALEGETDLFGLHLVRSAIGRSGFRPREGAFEVGEDESVPG